MLLTATPAGNSLVDFGWAAVEGAFQYQLQVDRIDVSQVRVIRDDAVVGTSFQTPAALAAGTYRVWVRAVSASGEMSNWSREVDFTVTQVAPEELLRTLAGLEDRLANSLPLLNIRRARALADASEFFTAASGPAATPIEDEIVVETRKQESLTSAQEFAEITRFWTQEALLLEWKT